MASRTPLHPGTVLRPMPESLRQKLGIVNLPEETRLQWLREVQDEEAAKERPAKSA